MTRRALFRLEAGRSIGLGHALRSLALADELATRGWSCRFALNPGAAALVAAIRPVAHERVEGEFDDPAALARAAPEGCDLLIFDSYRLDARLETPLRGSVSRILVIDDLADRTHDADLLVDTTYGRAAADYAALVPPAARVLTGPMHALLAERFTRARTAALARRSQSQSQPAQTILITLGGAPPAAMLLRLIAAARAAAPDAWIDVAAGAAEDFAPLDAKVRIHRGQVDMVALTARADLAVGAGGSSSWERCCLGLPAVLVEIADNQREVLAALDAAGAAASAGRLDALSDRELTRAIAAVAGDPTRLAAMGRRAALLCDGLGARRVANAAEALVDGGKPVVTLRPATLADGEVMLAWQQAPGVRRFAKTSRVPERAEHFAWLERRLADPLAGPFEIVEADGAPAGVLRFDREAPGEEAGQERYRISILIAPDRQGRGVASRALEAGGRLLAHATLTAEVLAGNEASHRLFAAAGYAADGPESYLRPPLFG